MLGSVVKDPLTFKGGNVGGGNDDHHADAGESAPSKRRRQKPPLRPVLVASEAEARMAKMAEAVKTLIECVGEDPEREGLERTPERAAKALLFFTKGYEMNVEEAVGNGVFDASLDEDDKEDGVEGGDGETTSEESTSSSTAKSAAPMSHGMVVVRGIEISSLCEHHLVPFTGTATIGYIPRRKVRNLAAGGSTRDALPLSLFLAAALTYSRLAHVCRRAASHHRQVLGLSKLARIADCYAQRLQVGSRRGSGVGLLCSL